MTTRSFAARARLLLPALLALGACQSGQSRPPAPSTEPVQADISSEFTATAQVTALAPAERVVTLRREDGTLFDVHAGEAVRNFDQIAVGDLVQLRYKERLAAVKLPPGELARPTKTAFAAVRAKPGAKPEAGLGAGLSVRVKIESIDRERELVVFSLASGELIARRIQTSKGRDFVQGLEVGDLVQLDYAEAVALSVEKQ